MNGWEYVLAGYLLTAALWTFYAVWSGRTPGPRR